MASVHPVTGSFGMYADKYVSPWAGFTVRLTYWFAQTVAIGAEVTAVGLYFGYWLPGVPSWVWIIGSSALVLAVNAAYLIVFHSVAGRAVSASCRSAQDPAAKKRVGRLPV